MFNKIALQTYSTALIQRAIRVSVPAQTGYVDGSKLHGMPTGLHEIHGCFYADLCNAARGDERALKLVQQTGYVKV